MFALCDFCRKGEPGAAARVVDKEPEPEKLEPWERETLLQDIEELNNLGAYWLYRDAGRDIRADKEIALAAMKKDGDSLQHATQTLKADKDVVLAAVMKNGRALQYAANTLKADKDVVLAAATKNGFAFCDAADKLKADKEFVIRAVVAGDGYALKFVKDTLKANKEVAIAAVTQNGRALEWAADNMKADQDVVLAAVEQNREAMDFVNKDATMWSEKDFVLPMVRLNGAYLKYAQGGLNQDEDCLRAAGLWDSNSGAAYSRSSWVQMRHKTSHST